MKKLMQGICRFLREEEGANGVEYALLAGLIAIAFVTGASALGQNLNTFFSNLSTCIATPNTTNCATPFAGGGSAG